jgi:trans-L-3-hydroxyproline dehydratase
VFYFSEALKGVLQLTHPINADLAFLYGTILTDGKDEYSEEESQNMCVFADNEVNYKCLWKKKYV